MAKISNLTELTTATDDSVLVINDGTPTTKKITVANLKASLGLPSRYLYATISQTSTNAPVMTVIKNTLGYTPTFLYDNVGSYSMLFDESLNNTEWIILNGGDKYSYVNSVRLSGGGVKIETFDGITKADGKLLDMSIKIEYYG
jgi:hypothetical protein